MISPSSSPNSFKTNSTLSMNLSPFLDLTFAGRRLKQSKCQPLSIKNKVNSQSIGGGIALITTATQTRSRQEHLVPYLAAGREPILGTYERPQKMS